MGKATHAPTISRAGGWSRIVVDPRHAEKLHAREPGDLFGVPSGGPVREGRAPHAGHARRRGVGSRRSTNEAAEQRGASLGGGGGGKGANQGEHRPEPHAPGTARARRVPGFGRCAPCFDLTPSSEVRAVCGNAARTDPRGGRSAMAVPTATISSHLAPFVTA